VRRLQYKYKTDEGVLIMNPLDQIKDELTLMKDELNARLAKSQLDDPIFIRDVKNELNDVELALEKMEYGLYGICEETLQKLPLEQLAQIPTARTIHDFLNMKSYLKKTLEYH
jgi:hypothetical protein